MKRLLLFFTAFFFIAACNKEKNNYKPPTDLARYTKKMAGKWLWQGWYWDGSFSKDSGGIFEIIFVNDTIIKFRETIFRFKWRNNLRDSEVLAYYVNPALDSISGETEGIGYWYKDDTLTYSKSWGMHKNLYLLGHR